MHVPGPQTLLPALCLAVAAACWLTSLVTGRCSAVDRLWSILPPIYTAILAAYAGFADPRLDLMTALTLLWSARLTYNFARKGGYHPGIEDYRWPVLRQRLGPALFQIFNLTFIALFQNALLLLLVGPAYVALRRRGTPLGWLDALAAACFLAFLLGETLADQQQWDFHRGKHARLAAGLPVDPPFLTAGLFRYSRHPNFFCEQAMWSCLYLFSVAAGAPWLNPSIAGAVVLVLLFQGSTAFTEQISLSKYPAYAEYRRRTSRLWPLPPRQR